MLATIRNRFRDVYRLRNRITGKSQRMVDRYLAEPRPHDEIISQRLSTQETVTIFDVGACECLDSIRYRRLLPQATIHAFEANPKNVIRAREMLTRYGTSGVVLNSIALSDMIGELDFFSSEGAPEGKFNDQYWDYGNKSGSILEPDMEKIQSVWTWLSFHKQEKIPCSTLTAYCQAAEVSKIDLLHLDVQGAEQMVLNGAVDMIDCISAIWLEVSSERFHVGQAVADDLYTFLRKHGFKCELRAGSGPQWDELWCQ